MKKIIGTLLAALVLIASVFVGASAASNPKFYCKDLDGKVGGKTTVTVGVEGRYENVGGLNIQITFDPKEIAYIDGSRALLCKSLQDGDANSDQAAASSVSLLWSSAKGEVIEGDIVSFQFNVVKSADSLKIKVLDMFNKDAKLTNILVSTVEITPRNYIINDAFVKAVIEKIEAIGAVENTAECKTRIDEARAAYDSLNHTEKAGVSNYSVLIAAELKYNAMQNADTDSSKLAAAFRNNNKNILSKTLDTVTIEDEAAVEAALSEWETLTVDAKIKVVTEKNLLNRLKKKIAELKATAEERAELLKEAQSYLKEFRTNYRSILNLKYEDIDYSYYEAFYNARNELKSYEDMNSMFSEIAAAEIEFVEKCYKRALDDKVSREDIDTSAADAAEAFSSRYGWILGMSADQVSADDLPDLAVASYAYSLLSSEAKSLLPNVEAKLSELISAAEALADGVEPEVVYKDRVVTKTVNKTVKVPVSETDGKTTTVKEKASVMFNAIIPDTKPIIWWLIGSAAVLSLISGFFVFLYLKLRKSKEVSENESIV